MTLTPINCYHLTRGHLLRSVKFHHMCEMHLSTYPSSVHLGVYPRKILHIGGKKHYTTLIVEFYIACGNWKQHKCSFIAE